MNGKLKISSNQSGFTLIELMIAMTVGLFILGAVSAVAINSGRSNRANDRTSELSSNGRYAMEILRRDIQHAGQTGLMPAADFPAIVAANIANGIPLNASGVAVTGDCAVGFATQLQQAITGANDNLPAGTGTNPNWTGCLNTGNSTTNKNGYATGDILVVRYADMSNAWPVAASAATTAPASAVANDIYFRSSYSVGKIYQKGGTAPTVIGNGPMQDQLLQTYVYYISPNTSSTVADGIPALYRIALNAGAMSSELVVSGIEQLQLQYGVVDATGSTQYLDANSVTDWTTVQSVRIWLLARNSSNERGEAYSNNTSYVMGSKTINPASGTTAQYRRQLYTTTVQLRN